MSEENKSEEVSGSLSGNLKDETRQKYEQRIDELYSGSPKNRSVQVMVMQHSDMLDMLKYGDLPIYLKENEVNNPKHPLTTAEIWKKLPDWIDNPALVFYSDTKVERLVFIAPETIDGNDIRIIIEPNSEDKLNAHILFNAYDGRERPTYEDWINKSLLVYADTEKVLRISERVGQRLPEVLKNPAFMPHSRIHSTSNGQVKATARRTKILTQKNLQGYRKQRQINLNQQIEQQKGNKMDEKYSQDNPYAAYAKDDEEVRQNADDWEMREPLTSEKLLHFNELAKKQGFTAYVENHHADTGVFQADKEIDETYRIEITGQFKNHGSQDAFESARDFTMTFHQGDEIVHYFYTNQLDKALEQAAEFSKNPAQWIENKDKTVEQHLSDLVDETVAIMQKHSVIEQGQVETKFGESQKVSGSLNEVESPNFQFTHKGLADRSAVFNQQLQQLAPEQFKELQPYFEQHKAIQTLQDLYKQTGDNARLDEMQEHNRLIEWKIHNKVEAYLGKHIDYSDMDYYKGIKTGEELQQMMNERLPESESVSGNPEPITETQSQPQVDEPKNFVQKFEENHQNAQNGENLANNGKNSAEILSESNISHPETFQKQVMFAKIEETEVSKMIDNLAKERTYLAVDIEHKDIAKGAGAKWDKILRAWYAEKGNLNETLQQFLPQQPEITVQNRKPYSDFMYQAQKIGIDLNESNFQEKFDSWVRCPVKGKGKSNRDGGYKLFRNDDGSIGATAKNYSTGDSVGWCDKTQGEKKVAGKVPLADFIANKKQTEWLEIAKNTVEQMVQQMRGNIAQDAYHQLQPALATDPYIQNKGISDIGKLKRLDDGSTIVPLYHNGKIANLQMIPAYDSSKKRLMTQAVKTGAYYKIGNGKNPQTVIIAEGVATADSVHQIANEIYGKDNVLTLSAIDSGSLKAVADKVDKVYPDSQKIIAADNDAHNATRAELKFKNAGKDKAEEVQQAYPDFALALSPALMDEKGNVKNTDWNDFLKAHGTENAIKAFSGSLNGVKQYTPKQHNNAQEHSKNGTDGREH